MGGGLKQQRVGARRGPRTPQLLSLVVVATAACGGTIPLVPVGEHPPHTASDLQRVGYPPPPALVEVLPLQRRDECSWRDGHWEWDGQAWHWTEGAWVLPPADCYYAPPETEWVRSGGTSQLMYRKPRWYPDPEKNALGRCAEARACTSFLPEVDATHVGPRPTDRPHRLPTPR